MENFFRKVNWSCLFRWLTSTKAWQCCL